MSVRSPLAWRAYQTRFARICFEAGTLIQHLFDAFANDGFDVVCMQALHIDAALSAMRNKPDKNDARAIAQVLMIGEFGWVHVKSQEAQRTRTLFNCRKALLNKTMI